MDLIEEILKIFEHCDPSGTFGFDKAGYREKLENLFIEQDKISPEKGD